MDQPNGRLAPPAIFAPYHSGMQTSDPVPLHIAIRCDALASGGTGHLIRQSALAEELLDRGHRVSLYGTSDVEWARAQIVRLGLEFIAPEEDFVAQLLADEAETVVIDGYEFPSGLGLDLREAGFPVVAMVDGNFGRHQVADIYVDQNLGSADPDEPAWLVGPEYVLLRDFVLTRRGEPRPANNPVKVLVVFGGSDPFAGAPVAVDLLAATGLPMEIVAVAASDERKLELEALTLGNGQSLKVLPPQRDLPGLSATCDVVVSAAGSSTWEFACLGIPTALVCVVDNQTVAYRAATEELAVPVGFLSRLQCDAVARSEARKNLSRLVLDAGWRDSLSIRGRDLVDGLGRQRVADVIEARDPTQWSGSTSPQAATRYRRGQPKWVLGTAQLGADYGIANTSGQPSRVQARQLLTEAARLGVTQIDTARAYGESEATLGFAISRGLGTQLSVVTKIRPLDDIGRAAPRNRGVRAVMESFEGSLDRLRVERVSALLVHRWADWMRASGAVAATLDAIVEEGRAGVVGASLSTPAEFIQAMSDPRVGYIQLPFNMLDRRWLADDVQEACRERPDVAVAVRSVFLQGLLADPAGASWPELAETDPKQLVKALAAALEVTGRRSFAELALAYVRAHSFVDSVVLGAETPWQVQDQACMFSIAPLDEAELEAVHSIVPSGSPELVNPSLWPR